MKNRSVAEKIDRYVREAGLYSRYNPDKRPGPYDMLEDLAKAYGLDPVPAGSKRNRALFALAQIKERNKDPNFRASRKLQREKTRARTLFFRKTRAQKPRKGIPATSRHETGGQKIHRRAPSLNKSQGAAGPCKIYTQKEIEDYQKGKRP